MHIIGDPAQIPPFDGEEEEDAFWATHSMGDEMFENVDDIEEGELPPVRPRRSPDIHEGSLSPRGRSGREA